IAFGEHETPESSEYVNRVIALIRAKRAQEALPIIEEGLSKFPQSAALHFEYGNVLNESDRYPQAISEYKRAMELDPPFPEAMIKTAYALVNSGKGGESIAIFEKYLHDYPNDPHIDSVKSQYLLVQANQYSEQGRFFDAKKLLEEAASF